MDTLKQWIEDWAWEELRAEDKAQAQWGQATVTARTPQGAVSIPIRPADAPTSAG